MNFAKRSIGMALAVLVVLSCGAGPAAQRPDIVLIMADDLGFADLGCYGGEIETPHLDSLAEGGLRFSQFYNTAKCHSSRVCLLTGLYCFQAGNSSLQKGVTIAQVLRRAGYFTAMTGKWHLKNQPTDWGFERYFGHLSGCCNFFKGDNTFRLNGQPFNDFGGDFYTTDANTDYAIRFLDEAAQTEKPFFLYIAYNAPHYPLHAPEKEVMKYRGKYRAGWDELRKQRYARQREMGLVKENWKLSPRPDGVSAWEELDSEQKDWEDFRMAAYAGMVDRLDRNIGRLVVHLKKMKRFDNTLILFCSDNGACPFERTRGREYKRWDPRSYWTYDRGWAHAGNTPFRWYKQNQHEGGISSPLVVHWPKGMKAEPGSITHQPGHLIDLMATLCELGGGEYPSSFDGRQITPLQGKSLAPVFAGKQREGHEYLYFQFSNNRAVRREPWKLVSARGGPWELYNIRDDRSELENMAVTRPELAAELKALWHKVAEDIDGAPEGLRKPVGEKSGAWSRPGGGKGKRKRKKK